MFEPTLMRPPSRELPPQRLVARRHRLLAYIAEDRRDSTALSPRRRQRSWLVPIGIATALTVIVVALLSTQHAPSAQAATPRLLAYEPSPGDPSAELARLADRAAAQPTPAGNYSYLKLQSWALNSRIDGKLVTSRVVPTISERWIDDSGDGRVVSTVDGQTTTEPVHERLMYHFRDLSTNWQNLQAQLAQAHPVSDGAAETLTAFVDVWLEGAPPPALQGALLALLSHTPDLSARGTVVDRLGRSGVAFDTTSSYSGLPTKYTLIFDPRTGALLDYEQELTTTAGALNVKVPAVIGYTIWVATGKTTNTEHAP